MAERKVYKNPKAGQPLISVISSGVRTPILEVKFCNLVKAFYYPNSPSIPRYSVTCVFDPKDHDEFIKAIYGIEKNEKVDTIIKKETEKVDGQNVFTGKVLIKFQNKDKVPAYIFNEKGEPEEIELEDELAKGEKISVIFDILRYTKKGVATTEHGISFKPSCIYYYPPIS